MANAIEPSTQNALLAFRCKLVQHFDVKETVLFGSRAKGTHHAESDTDVAVLLNGARAKFLETKFAMDDLAYEVLLDTGVRIQPLPIWTSEWDKPAEYSNPQLLFNIRREGIVL
jgi:antitoxin ChpS